MPERTLSMPDPDMMPAEPPVVRLANDIARQFGYLPPDDGAAAVATHLRSFWDPRMRDRLAAEIDRDPSRLDPLVVQAMTSLATAG